MTLPHVEGRLYRVYNGTTQQYNVNEEKRLNKVFIKKSTNCYAEDELISGWELMENTTPFKNTFKIFFWG